MDKIISDIILKEMDSLSEILNQILAFFSYMKGFPSYLKNSEYLNLVTLMSLWAFCVWILLSVYKSSEYIIENLSQKYHVPWLISSIIVIAGLAGSLFFGIYVMR